MVRSDNQRPRRIEARSRDCEFVSIARLDGALGPVHLGTDRGLKILKGLERLRLRRLCSLKVTLNTALSMQKRMKATLAPTMVARA